MMMHSSLKNLSVQKNELVENSLNLKLRYNNIKNCLIWGLINFVIFSILLYDISKKCTTAFSKWYYCEYIGIGITAINIILHTTKLIYFILSRGQLKGSIAQRNLLKFDDADRSFVITNVVKPKPVVVEGPTNFAKSTLFSSRSLFVGGGGRNSSRSSHETSLNNSSMLSSIDHDNSSSYKSISEKLTSKFVYTKYSKRNIPVRNEKELEVYLKNYRQIEQSQNNISRNIFNQSSLNSFWYYCSSAAKLLKTSLYQLAPSTLPKANVQHHQVEVLLNNEFDTNADLIQKIPSARLSKCVTNIRHWIALTILHRLEARISRTNQEFLSCGLAELQIGTVGLERLKKTVEHQQFSNTSISILSLLLPFLEITSNQEYLVQRIRDLAKGNCISNFQWNGQLQTSLKWDNSLPTDSAILFNLFCTYLDANLMPVPGQKPFYDRYVIIDDITTIKERLKRNPIANKGNCAILCNNELNPKFNFIVENTIHKCAYDKKNLFHVIIQFLYYIKTNHDGVLEGVNLGAHGINILCIFD